MNLRDLIEQDDGAAMITQIARQLGIDEATARQGIEQLAPAVARGVQRNAGAESGLDGLLEGLGGSQARTIPGESASGNDILRQIFGDKDVSRNVAGYASKRTGLDSSLLKRMLPLVAMAVVMLLKRRMEQGGNIGAGGSEVPGWSGGAPGQTGGIPGQTGGAQGGSLTDVLGRMLDADGDGSAVDDLLNMARKYF